MENLESYIENPSFLEFLNREFENVVLNCSVEEIAEFAFGSFENAVVAFVTKEESSSETA